MVPAGENQRSRLLFTFAEGDLALVRPFAEQLRMSGTALTVDFGLSSEPFATQRSDYIRASLAIRIRHCLSTVCLFGPDTFADDWVLWTLEAAHSFGRPIVAAPLTAAPSPQAVDLFTSLGAAIVPPKADLFVRHLARMDEKRDGPSSAVEEAELILRAMRHPLR